MHVPGIKMKRHEWKVKIPEITMLPQEWKLHIPEVTMKEHRWVFDLPKITVGGPEDELEAKQKAATSYGQKAQKLAEAMSDEIELAAKDYLLDVRKEIDGQFTGPIAQLEASLAAAPNESIRAEITANLNDLRSKRTEALAQVDQQIVLLTQ
jgi:predicted RNA-binding protein Jag